MHCWRNDFSMVPPPRTAAGLFRRSTQRSIRVKERACPGISISSGNVPGPRMTAFSPLGPDAKSFHLPVMFSKIYVQ